MYDQNFEWGRVGDKGAWFTEKKEYRRRGFGKS